MGFGRILGIPLSIHVSWFPILGLVVWLTASEFEGAFPGMGTPTRLAMAAVTGVAFFACLLAHEVAHALVARRLGVPVRRITLFMFGGIAEIGGEPSTPAEEFAVALTGPATSVLLGGVFALTGVWAGDAEWAAVEGVATVLALVNLGVAAFNMVPGLPLDGGRLLRAGVWWLTGDRRRATRIAAAGGHVLALGLGGTGLVLAMAGDLLGLWYVMVGAFVWFLARGATRETASVPSGPGALALPREGEATQPRP